MSVQSAGKYEFEVGMYRPPSEGGSHSLLLRFTRNCPWNKCTFCAMYKHEKFSLRPVAEIKGDIDAIAEIIQDMQTLSWKQGHAGQINRDVIVAMIGQDPALNKSHGFSMVLNWLSSGAKTAFLQDGNSLMMPTDKLVEVLTYLRSKFPSIERCTTYARSKTLARKPQEDLTAIRKAGLDRLHVGLETGDDILLKKIKKGVSGKEHIEGGKKALAAGFQLSEYWMPGLGGKEDWERHARNTALVLNQINPDYIRSRPFYPFPGTPIHESQKEGRLTLLSPQETLQELKLLIETLDVTSKVCFDHAGNCWVNQSGGLLFTQSYEGYTFPNEKQRVLDLIDEGIQAQRGKSRSGRFRLVP